MDYEEPRPFAQRGKLCWGSRARAHAKADSQTGSRNYFAYTSAEPPDDRFRRRRIEVSAEDIKEFVKCPSNRPTRQQDVGDLMAGGEGLPARGSSHIGRDCKLKLVQECIA